MWTLPIVGFLSGTVLGLRFRFHSVVLAICLFGLLTVGIGIVSNAGGLLIIGAVAANIVAVQMGYFCGIALQLVLGPETRISPERLDAERSDAVGAAGKRHFPAKGTAA